MGKSLYFSDRVYRIDTESHNQATGLSFGVAGASFAAVLAIACFAERTALLSWSASCFVLAMPMAVGHAMIVLFAQEGGWSTRTGRLLGFATAQLSHIAGFAGLALLAFQISRITGTTFLIAGGCVWFFGWLFSRSYGRSCARLEQREQENPALEDIQPPLA